MAKELDGDNTLKDFEAGFREVEKRVQTLAGENQTLRKRMEELEQELSRLRQQAGDLEAIRGMRLQVREKIERVLKTLEATGEKR